MFSNSPIVLFHFLINSISSMELRVRVLGILTMLCLGFRLSKSALRIACWDILVTGVWCWGTPPKTQGCESTNQSLSTDLTAGVRFDDHDQERVNTSVNRSCVLALHSVTYFNVRSEQTSTEVLSRLSSGQRGWT